ncbi:MAG TPA: hypothetical protein DGT23_09820 [Micromonosporaceae bacterium]|nr:hypothetical protein [Micromonosporaceae bacterium]
MITDDGRTDPEQPLHLFIAGAVGGHQVEMNPVLDALALGHDDEKDMRAFAFRGLEDRLGVTGLVVRMHRPSGDLAPESGEQVRVGTVDRDVSQL